MYNQHRKPMSVTELDNYVNHRLNSDPRLSSLLLEGEISNYRPRKGAQFLTLKDQYSTIDTVIFAKIFAQEIHFTPKEGMTVVVEGRITTYPKNGRCQFQIFSMEPQGIGSRYIAYQQLKEKLSREGLFAPEHKKALPEFPKRIAVITSRSGAVIRDIIKTIRSRWPSTQIVLYPAQVQGQGSANSLIMQLKNADVGTYDDIIIGRGGGSPEDLWSFNDPNLAHAIYDCRTPVISSVGHGTDHTITDDVADKSVVTPTAAAETATPDGDEIKDTIDDQLATLNSIINSKLNDLTEQLGSELQEPVMINPQQMYEGSAQELKILLQRLDNIMQNRFDHASNTLNKFKQVVVSHAPQQNLANKEGSLKVLLQRLDSALHNAFQIRADNLGRTISKLNVLNPLNIMSRGYSLVVASNHRILNNADQLSPGQRVKLYLAHGSADATVNHVDDKNIQKGSLRND